MPLGTVTKRVSNYVREMMPKIRHRLTVREYELAIHLRGNSALLETLKNLIQERIKGREQKPVPSDPILCMATMLRDKELRWLISRLEYIHDSPVIAPIEQGEQPE